ncbi:sulfotransferase family protein [Vallicoccus soli]|uniref:Sulfotransferase n=1 Tax=Vallicoccus soli TaxID=2339232 RepID=A0A3A3Z0U9_9ACTN|nr:sulfotransferase [Vallicoccus soli]RJK97880.1 sulfotransferase [Vallicoccus soli]
MPEAPASTQAPQGARADGDPGDVDVVLVAGNSRSGTTMLARMLGRHPRVVDLGELHFAEEMWLPADRDRALGGDEALALADRLLHNRREWYHRPHVPGAFAEVAREALAPLAERPGPVRGHDVLAAVLAHEAAAEGGDVALEQTPRNVFYLTELLDLLPRARAVVLVRDPRDVLLSQKNWWRRRFRGTSGVPLATTFRQWADYHPLTTSLLWRGGVRAGLRAAEHPRVALLRFEDLVQDPQGELERLLRPWGLDVAPGMLDVPRISSSNSTDRGGSGVDPSVVGQWRTGLGRAETWLSQRVTAPEAQRLGYAPVPLRPPVLRLAGQALALPGKTALAVALNRGRSRSLLTSVRRRLRG